MNRFRRYVNEEERTSNSSAEDSKNNPFNQLKMCKEKLKDISDVLKNLSNKL
ncbi:MAG: hypothetical protein JW776_10800 [Candidatus Lokiarchaeota archaeon]|nr:hypothetical protein [Candidatus Lokiarchaeota archaeon]